MTSRKVYKILKEQALKLVNSLKIEIPIEISKLFKNRDT